METEENPNSYTQNDALNVPQKLSEDIVPLAEAMKPGALLEGVSSLLSWDQETYMPFGSAELRSQQLSLIAKLTHEHALALSTHLEPYLNTKTGELSTKGLSLSDVEQRLLHRIFQDWRKETAVSTELVGQLSEATSQAIQAWKTARDSDDFSVFAPHLETLVSLSKERANQIDPDAPVYDVLLDDYEPGMTGETLNPLFKDLRAELVSLLEELRSSSRGQSPDFVALNGPFDTEKQWQFGITLLKKMGYDFEKGRQDKSLHPFTIGNHPHDSRITTRLDEKDLMEALSSSVHEGGHALYEQGLLAQFFGTPLCQSSSLGIHESQSRLWENYVCKSEGFWQGHYPELQRLFPKQLGIVSCTDFYHSINQVKPSLIRVGADELTYNLHIMIRYELEKDLFNGRLSVRDLPDAWDSLYQEYLGIVPSHLSEGVLQDIHWASGLFGYFPTYALGNLYGRQLMDTAFNELPTLEDDIRLGHFSELRDWLRVNIHQKGRLYTAEEISFNASGKKLGITPFMSYLSTKYKGIYNV